jgi:spermidine synthase
MDDFIYEDIAVNSHRRNMSLGLRMTDELYKSQRVEIYNSEAFGRCLYLDGALQCSEADERIYHETLVHTCFGERERKSVLIIGGGDGGTLREVLKYKGKGLEKVTFVEINPEVIEACKKHFPQTELEKSLADPIVELVIADGAKFLSQEGVCGLRYDAILIDCPDPSAESSVLHSREFIEKALAPALNRHGFIGIQAGNVFIKEGFVRALQYELKRVFSRCKYIYAPMPSFPSGGIGFLFAGDVSQFSALKKLDFETHYVNMFNRDWGQYMVPNSFTKNKRVEKLEWYCENISDITKNWRASPAATEVFRAFMSLEDEPQTDPQHTLMSFFLCFVPEIRVQEVRFWTEEPDRVKNAIDGLLKERLAFPHKGLPIHGISFSEDTFTTHQLVKVEDLKSIDERLYAKKPEICFDEAVLSITFMQNGERVSETVTYSDLGKDYVTNGLEEKPAEFICVRTKTHPWRERLEPSIQEVFDKMAKAGMMVDRVLWVHRGRANLRFKAG